MKIMDVMKLFPGFRMKTRQSAAAMCADGTIPAVRIGNTWDIDDEYVRAVQEFTGTVIQLGEILSECGIDKYSGGTLKKIQRGLWPLARYAVQDSRAAMFADKLIPSDKEREVKREAAAVIEKYDSRASMVPMRTAAERMGLSVYRLKNLISNDAVPASRVGNDWYLAESDIKAYLDKAGGLCGVYTIASEMAPGIRTLFNPEDRICRNALFNYMRQSPISALLIPCGEAGLSGDRRNAFYVPAKIRPQAEAVIADYLKHYGNVEERGAEYMADPYWESHPENLRLISLFRPGKTPQGMAALLESILAVNLPEISECTNEDILSLSGYAENAQIRIYGQYVCQFVNFCARHAETGFTVALNIDRTPDAGTNIVVNNEPYSFSQYLLACHMCTDDGYIREHHLIEKALADGKYAYLWLRMIWSFTASWRNSDFNRMPVVKLPHGKEEAERMIREGGYDSAADTVSLLLEHEINGRYSRPNKTKHRQDGHYRIVYFPEPYRKIIGTVYSICLLHCGDVWQEYKLYPATYTEFFGDDYRKVFGYSTYSLRRAAKTFMGGIADVAERSSGTDSKIIGYICASYSRGHSFDNGTVAEATSHYLTCRLDGMSRDDILRMLWANGTCGFVPYMLLSAVYGESYDSLPVRYQSAIIASSGLTADMAENTAVHIRRSYYYSSDLVSGIMRQYPDKEHAVETMDRIVSAIAMGSAPGKEPGCQCIMGAMNRPCPYAGKESCLGCRYSVYQRGAVISVMEYIRDVYRRLSGAETDNERKKLRTLLTEAYLPAVLQILHFAKAYGMDIEEYKQEIIGMIEEGGRINAHNND